MTSVSRRDQLLDTAVDLFFRHGCHTTGIDKLLAEAGVAKMTLYKHFNSKEELILAAAQRRSEQMRDEFLQFIAGEELSPAQRLLAIFDYLEKRVDKCPFLGDPFVNLSVEFPDLAHPIHQAAAEHKRLVLGYVMEQAKGAAAADAENLARQLLVLLQGATVVVQVTGEKQFAKSARAAAASLIAQATGLPEATLNRRREEPSSATAGNA